VLVATPAQFLDALPRVAGRPPAPDPVAAMSLTGSSLAGTSRFEQSEWVPGRATMAGALLVAPSYLGPGEGLDNGYRRPVVTVDVRRAMQQHHALVETLGAFGVPALVLPGLPAMDEAAFVAGVYATVPGRFVVGAMRHGMRRLEAEREDVRRLMTEVLGYGLVDLAAGLHVAEATGSLVVDRARGIGFCGLSPRADESGCAALHAAFRLRLCFRFALRPGEHHTSMVLAVLAGRACVMDPGAFADPTVPEAIAAAYPGRVLELDAAEQAAFAGGCVAVTEGDVLFSQTAFAALRAGSRAALEAWGFRLHAVAVDEFEKAGGSLRCLISELY
jgi:N-dimethylarginine dimethylaminohydrolase